VRQFCTVKRREQSKKMCFGFPHAANGKPASQETGNRPLLPRQHGTSDCVVCYFNGELCGLMEPNSLGTRQDKRVRILIADNHSIVRHGLSQQINQQPDMCVTATARGMTKALQIIQSDNVNFVITEVSLGDGSGIDLIKHVKAQFHKLPVLVFSMHDESLFAERALKAGALGYIMKRAPVKEVITAIRHVCTGNIYTSEQMTQWLLTNQTATSTDNRFASLEKLTDRELEVYDLIGRGKDTREIAALLHIDTKTVGTHRVRIIHKLGLKNMAGLIHETANWSCHKGDKGEYPDRC
jgi:DNA-binding NarL/FixJ family response regulator